MRVGRLRYNTVIVRTGNDISTVTAFSRQGQTMDFQLTGQERRMVEAVRDLAQGEFKPNAQKYMDGTFPWENIKKLAEIGVLGMSVPEEYGGLRFPGVHTPPVLPEIAQTRYVTAMANPCQAGGQTPLIPTYAPQ